jgi:ABC-2 type transport system permease protein
MQIKNKLTLIFHFAILNIQIRYKSSYLGVLWTALEPLLYFSVLYLVFTAIRGRESDFAIYLITGIMLFHIFTRGTSAGVSSLTGNSGLIKSLRIKKDFFPVVATTATAILAIVSIGVFFGLMPVFEFVPTWTLILLPILFIFLFVLILGLSYLLSITNVFVRDVQVIWSIFTHVLLFASPIFWKIDEVKGAGGEFLLLILQINPLGQIIELGHKLVVDGEIPQLEDWLYTGVFVIAIFFVGYFVFQKLQEKVVEEL